jgi:hypothetical protein
MDAQELITYYVDCQERKLGDGKESFDIFKVLYARDRHSAALGSLVPVEVHQPLNGTPWFPVK